MQFTDIPDHLTAKEIRIATLDDEHSDLLSEYVFCSWSSLKAEVQKELQS